MKSLADFRDALANPDVQAALVEVRKAETSCIDAAVNQPLESLGDVCELFKILGEVRGLRRVALELSDREAESVAQLPTPEPKPPLGTTTTNA